MHVVGRRHRHGEVLPLASGRDCRVRSKTHWIGVPTPARNGSSQHLTVEDDVHVDDRGLPSRADQPGRVAALPAGSRRSVPVGGHGQHHLVDLVMLTVALADQPAAGVARRHDLDLGARAGPPPRPRRARRTAASPCSCCSGTTDQPMSPAPGSVSRPVWKTIAASASEALVRAAR